MSKDKIYIFDTTLRDGAQTQGVDFSLDDKLKIANSLDALGVDYIEGGWPGANPTDTEFFQQKIKYHNSILTSFGIIFVAPIPSICPKVRTEGIVGLAFLETICCNDTMIFEASKIESMHVLGSAPCPPFPFTVT